MKPGGIFIGMKETRERRMRVAYSDVELLARIVECEAGGEGKPA